MSGNAMTGVRFVLAVGLWVAAAGCLEAPPEPEPAPSEVPVEVPALERACGNVAPSELERSAIQTLLEGPRAAGRATGSVSIPVHFHVIKKGTGLANGDIPTTVLQQQVAILNTAFASSAFKFTLASVDGTINTTWFSALPGSQANLQMKTALRRGGKGALNIYTLERIGSEVGASTWPWDYNARPIHDGVFLYHATLPGGAAAPLNQGDNAVHEVGHWLGLYHTFEGGCGPEGDFVNDTPPEATPATGCPVNRDTCSAPGMDPIRNYMDYTDDACMDHFTPGQLRRMDLMHLKFRATCTLDTTPPEVSLTHPAAGPMLPALLVISADATDNGEASQVALVEFFVDDTLIGFDDSAPFNALWDSSQAASGPHTLKARAYDASCGNSRESAVTVLVDRTAPTVSISSPTNGSKVEGTVTVGVNADDDAQVSKVDCMLGTSFLGTDTSSPFQIPWSTSTNGPYTLTCTAQDGVGRTATSSAVSVTVHNAPPSVSITAPVANARLEGPVTIKASASDTVKMSRVEFLVNGGLIHTATTPSSGSYSAPWNTALLASGSYTLTARAHDAAGNMTESAAVRVTVDNTPPTVSITYPIAGITVASTVNLQASATDSISVKRVEFRAGNVLIGAATGSGGSYSLGWNNGGLPCALYELTAIAYDLADHATVSAPVEVRAGHCVTEPDCGVNCLCGFQCPEGYHPVSFTCNSTDCTAPCTTSNAVVCAPNTESFNMCGNICPAGWGKTSSGCDSACGPNCTSSGGSNYVRCQKQ